MKKNELCEKGYYQIRINNHRVLELVRMIREVMPIKERESDDYDFCEVLGIVQEILMTNEDLLDRFEMELLKITI